ncbi:MAG: hypothetical protein FJ297_17650 [Planctomycetes bacterium]|nr:hypothetical protein [Planctomycetota bacterium]
MASTHAFGNDPAKIERYRRFWSRESTDRPLVGFTFVGWYPLKYFRVARSWPIHQLLTPDMLRPAEWFDDYEDLLREGERIDDDMLRGACPIQVAFPVFIPAVLGCPIRVLPDNVLGDELFLSFEEAMERRLDTDNPWFQKYVEFLDALIERSAGRYPISHGTELGPTDLHALLRGASGSIYDLMDEPAATARLLEQLGDAFIQYFQESWRRIPLFHGGYFDAQYQVWSPEPIIRMQEDATASFSPRLYRQLVQPVDRRIASHFPCNFIHLHPTSMFMLDALLEIEELRGFQINLEPFNTPVPDMLPFFRQVQAADRPLLVRGHVTPDELKLFLDNLDPRGLYFHIMPKSEDEIEPLKVVLGMG